MRELFSILLVSFCFLQIPSNLLLAKIGRPRIYIPICVAVWGLVSGLSAVVHNFTGLLLGEFKKKLSPVAYLEF